MAILHIFSADDYQFESLYGFDSDKNLSSTDFGSQIVNVKDEDVSNFKEDMITYF